MSLWAGYSQFLPFDTIDTVLNTDSQKYIPQKWKLILTCSSWSTAVNARQI